MNTQTILKIAKIGTAISAITLILPGDFLFSESVPTGIVFLIMFLFGFTGALMCLAFWACITYLFLSAARKWDNNYDDMIVILMIIGAYLCLFNSIEQYISYGNTSSYCTTAVFLVFSIITLITSVIRLVKRCFI